MQGVDQPDRVAVLRGNPGERRADKVGVLGQTLPLGDQRNVSASTA